MNQAPATNECWVRKNGRYPDNAIKIAAVTVSFFPEGGGFHSTLPIEKFLAEFRPVHKDDQDPKFRLAFFAFDEGPTIYAWTTGARWNGWGCPLIERSVLEHFIKEEGADNFFRLDGDKLYYDEKDYPEQEPELPFTIHHGGREYTVFSTGNFGLTWNQYDPEDIDPDNEELVHDCLNAISPPGITPSIPIKS